MLNRGYIELFKVLGKFGLGMGVLSVGYVFAARRYGTLIPGMAYFLLIWLWLIHIHRKGVRNGGVAQQIAVEEAARRLNERR